MEGKEHHLKTVALSKGVEAVGIASVSEINKFVPKGYRPDDLLKGAKSVIVVGKKRYTMGQWMSPNIDTIHRNRMDVAYGSAAIEAVANLIESEYGHPALGIVSSMFETGLLPPLSLKVCAEHAGLGTRSMAGGIILSAEHGLLGFAAVITSLELQADGPLPKPVCPDRVCVNLWERNRKTPCMKSCRAIEGELEGGRIKEVRWYRHLCATRALTTMNTAYLRLLSEIIEEEDPGRRKYLAIGQARKFIEDPPGRGIWGRCIECMRVCPVNRRALRLPKGDTDVQAN